MEVEALAGGPPVVITGAKQVALLSALCALAGERVSRDLLREAGWGDDPGVTDATLENHIWRLRKTIEPAVPASDSCIVHESGGYRIALPIGSIDSERFGALADDARQAARRAEYGRARELCEGALRLWRGDAFRVAAHVPGIQAAIDRLTETRAQLEERRVDALLALGETEQAALDAAQLTTRNPFREHLWAQRMTALARLGRVEEALSTYRAVRAVLREELGIDPGRELRELQRAIIAQEEAVSPVAGAAEVTATARTETWTDPAWPLIGRVAETEGIADALTTGNVVVIDGPAGVGRTRLLDEAARIARDSGATVLRFVGTRSAPTVPLGVFADVVPLGARADDPLILLQRCGQALRAQASGGRIVLCVDDAQLLDDPSAALLLHLAGIQDITIALTVRTREPRPDAITALLRRAGTRVVEIGALDEGEAARLLESALGGSADPFLHRWAYRTTRGNAFHLVELVRGLRHEGSVRREGTRWVADRVPPLPASLGELVQSALERLEPDSRDAIDRLALAEPIRLTALDEDGALMPALEAQGLVSVEGTGSELRAVLAHPLFSAVLRELLPPLRAHRLRLDLIARFRAHSGLTADERLRLAQWRMDVGDAGDLPEVVAAARLALASNDPALSLQLLAQAGEDDSQDEPSVDVDVRLLRARAHVLRREHGEAAVALLSVEPALRTPEQAAAYVETQLEVTRFGRAMVDDLPALFLRAASWWPGDEEWTRRIGALRLRDVVFENQAGAAEPGPSGAVPDSARLGALYYAGRTTEARALWAQLAQDPPFLTLDAATAAAIGARNELDRGDALAALETRLVTMRTTGYDVDDPAAIGIATAKLADLRMLQAEPGEACALYSEAARQWERRDPIALRASAWAGIAISASQLGDRELSGRAIGTMREIAGETPRAHLVPYVAHAEAVLAVHAARPADATALLDAAVVRLAASAVHTARLHYERVLLGLPIDDASLAALRKAAEASDSPLMHLYQAHARALAQRDAHALHDVGARFRALGVIAYARRAEADAVRLGT